MTTVSTVLVVVEDEPDFRVLIRAALREDPRIELSGEVTTVEEAVALARASEPALIILDHNLEGEMVGIDAAPKLKAASPDTKILLFTAYDVAAEARREPAIDGFLRKDDVAKLLATVRGLLGLDA